MAADQQERKLRDLVETAGFELAVSLDQPGAFRITAKDLAPVGAAVVTARGFRASFPTRRAHVDTPSALVDVLEAIKSEEKGNG